MKRCLGKQKIYKEREGQLQEIISGAENNTIPKRAAL